MSITYPQTLLNFAKRLIDDQQFSIAVVVCHMACEIATERALSKAFTTKNIEYLKDPVMAFLNGYNLGSSNKRNRKLYTALTGDKIQDQLFWSKLKKSSEYRNDIIHKGKIAEKVEAEDSYRAASDFVAHLTK